MVRVATCGLYKSLRDSRVQLRCACCLLQTTLRTLPTRHFALSLRGPLGSLATGHRSTAIPHLPRQPAAPGSSVSAGMATRVTAGPPSTSLRATNTQIGASTSLQPQETGLSLSWTHVPKQLGWSLAPPNSTSTGDSAHTGTYAPVTIRSPHWHAGMAVTNLSLCLYTSLSLCQIQQGMRDANAFTPTCFV